MRSGCCNARAAPARREKAARVCRYFIVTRFPSLLPRQDHRTAHVARPLRKEYPVSQEEDVDKHVGTELKAAFGELQTLATRLVDSGRAWWDNRRDDMNRNDQQYYGQGRDRDREESDIREQYGMSGRHPQRDDSMRDEGMRGRGAQGQRAPFGPQPGREQSGSRGYEEDMYYGRGIRYAGSRDMDEDDAPGRDGATGYSQGRQGYGRHTDQNLGQGSYGQPDLGQGGYGRHVSWNDDQAGQRARYGQRDSAYGPEDFSQRDMSGFGRRQGGARGQPDAQRFQGEQGRFRGHGPKGYRRSDERITEDLNERLTEDAMLDASNITVEVSNGVATLQGTVESRWMKHRAEDIADACSGISDVRNEIRVGGAQPGADRQRSSSSRGSKDLDATPESGAASSQVGTPH